MKKTIALLLILSVYMAVCTSCGVSPNESSHTPAIENTSAPIPTGETMDPAIPDPVIVSPLPVTIDLDNCTIAVSLSEGSFFTDSSGALQILAAVYTYDLYDAVDISLLKAGDTIMIRNQKILITSLEHSNYGSLMINGGLDVGGYELRTDENTVYYETGYSDVKAWVKIGVVSLSVSQDFVYTDTSDLDGEPVVYDYNRLLQAYRSIDYSFTPQNTTLVIENGVATAMNRIYAP